MFSILSETLVITKILLKFLKIKATHVWIVAVFLEKQENYDVFIRAIS